MEQENCEEKLRIEIEEIEDDVIDDDANEDDSEPINVNDIEPEEYEEEEKIKEIRATLNTGNLNAASMLTDKINGQLECLIIKASKPASVEVSIFDLDVCLYKNINVMGTNYLLLRELTMASNAEKFTFQSGRFILNDRIKFEITGVNDTEVEVIIRYT